MVYEFEAHTLSIKPCFRSKTGQPFLTIQIFSRPLYSMAKEPTLELSEAPSPKEEQYPGTSKAEPHRYVSDVPCSEMAPIDVL